MSFIEKFLVVIVVLLVILVHTADYNDTKEYIELQCELTPQWAACQGE